MIAEDIANKLQTAGLGTVGTDIFISHMPDTPNNGILVVDTLGTQGDEEIPEIQAPNFQTIIRNTSYTAALAKAKAVRDALHGLANVTLTNYYAYYISANAEPGHIGRDANNREEFSINFRTKVREL